MAHTLPPRLYLPLAAPEAVTMALISAAPVALAGMVMTLVVCRSTQVRAVAG